VAPGNGEREGEKGKRWCRGEWGGKEWKEKGRESLEEKKGW